ncbi:hypothetical protein MRY87_13655 [bacterium]|nr:hypothetical protein [bacterium]
MRIAFLFSFLATFISQAAFADGARIAFSAYRDGAWQVYVMDEPKATPKRIHDGSRGDASAPRLSPTGDEIAYEVQGIGIYVCETRRPTQCETVRSPRGTAVRPRWIAHPKADPKRPWLAFVQYSAGPGTEDAELALYDRKATRVFLTQTGIQDYPAPDPSGRFLVYTSGHTVGLRQAGVEVFQQLWRIDLQSGLSRQLLISQRKDIQPEWHPNGEKIAFASDRVVSGQGRKQARLQPDTSNFKIFTARADGSELNQVTEDGVSSLWPAWSPDGKELMYTRVHEGKHRLYIVNPSTGKSRQFVPFSNDSSIEVRDADWR